jgi:hypothetical protein
MFAFYSMLCRTKEFVVPYVLPFSVPAVFRIYLHLCYGPVSSIKVCGMMTVPVTCMLEVNEWISQFAVSDRLIFLSRDTDAKNNFVCTLPPLLL